VPGTGAALLIESHAMLAVAACMQYSMFEHLILHEAAG